MSSAPARFTFDLNLREEPRQVATLPVEEHVLALQQARGAGFAEGFSAGERGATAAAAASLAAATAVIADRCIDMLGDLDRTRAEARRQAIGVAAAVGRKLAHSLMVAQPEAELTALFADCLTGIDGAPHLVVRCHPDLADRLKPILTERAIEAGYAGRLIVLGEPDISIGNGRIEWADGGLVRDEAAIEAAIDQRIAEYLAARAPSNDRNND